MVAKLVAKVRDGIEYSKLIEGEGCQHLRGGELGYEGIVANAMTFRTKVNGASGGCRSKIHTHPLRSGSKTAHSYVISVLGEVAAKEARRPGIRRTGETVSAGERGRLRLFFCRAMLLELPVWVSCSHPCLFCTVDRSDRLFDPFSFRSCGP